MKRVLTIFLKYFKRKRKPKRMIGRAYSYGRNSAHNGSCHEIEFVIKIKPGQLVFKLV